MLHITHNNHGNINEASDPEDVVVSLEGGSHSAGTLIVTIGSDRGAVCGHESWTTSNIDVACRSLGYLDGGSKTVVAMSSVPYIVHSIHCTGDEEQLESCPGWTQSSQCSTDDRVMISCLDTTGIALKSPL